MDSGFAFIDKPSGMTSHDVVARVRRALRTRRVGHAGTLDPSATGVLIIGVGRATRLMSLASGADKTYFATIRLGQSTDSDDADGVVVSRVDATGIGVEQIDEGLRRLTGPLMQVPSSVSAVKVDGQRAHARIRAGEAVELPARPVQVHAFVREGLQRGEGVIDLQVTVRCGTGTYVRALARDLGHMLGVGGHVLTLRRTESAGVSVTECAALEQFQQDPRLLPALDVVRRWVPVVSVDAQSDADIRHGRSVDVGVGYADRVVAVEDPAGSMIALAKCQDGVLQPTVVMGDPASGRTPRTRDSSTASTTASGGTALTGE